MINNKKIGLIAAVDCNGLIGYGNKIPWHSPEDLKRFKTLTLNSTLIMGRKTWQSLPGKLPERKVHVLHQNVAHTYQNEDDVKHYFSIMEAIKNAETDDVWIAGGAEIYKEALVLSVPDFIDLTIHNFIYVPPIKDNYKVSKEKSVYLPTIPFCYSVISETQFNDTMFIRRYELRDPWNYSLS